MNSSTERVKHEPLSVWGMSLFQTDNIPPYPYIATYTQFVMKSINDNNFDSLYLKNLTNNVDYNGCHYNHINNFNHHLPLMLGGSGDGESSFKTLKCSINHNKQVECEFDNTSINLINDTYKPKKQLSNNHLNAINVKKAIDICAFFIENHKKYGNCIILIRSGRYHIYSLDNDKWLSIDSGNKKDKNYFECFYEVGSYSRSLLFDQS